MQKQSMLRSIVCLMLSLLLVGCTPAGDGGQTASGTEEKSDGYPSPAKTVAPVETGGLALSFRATEKYFYHNADEKWQLSYLKGVNIGLTEATTSLADPNTTYETYLRWLGQIAAMNANTVKVYTEMPPAFYQALYDYNKTAEQQLYLIQGIWFSEELMTTLDDAFAEDETISKSFLKAAKEITDIIHGNCRNIGYGSKTNVSYFWDVSPYVAGYVLGLEWEPGFVARTNAHTDRIGYTGKYLATDAQATAFESFLCQVGDELIAYETAQYAAQTPVGFLNWQTTDPLTHTNEPFDEEDAVSLVVDHLLPQSSFYGGLFIAMDAYPYYPEFMNHQPEYQKTDDAYLAYLTELTENTDLPLLLAECGVPTSRGRAHTAANGMSQGRITETQQGTYLSAMIKAAAKAGCAGSMLFSWQDEWFKQTWNTVAYAPENAADRTPNVQSAEQSYGLLAMEPGETACCLIDGKTTDWAGASPIARADGMTLYAKWDAAYLYFYIDTGAKNIYTDTVLVPISLSGLGSRSVTAYHTAFTKNTDFLLVLSGKNSSRLLCDAYEDAFDYRYGTERQAVAPRAESGQKNTGSYHTILQFLSNEMTLPLEEKTIGAVYYESGLLTYGISDPDSPAYSSLADFYAQDNVVEVRLPWYLLNVMNSTEGRRLNDFYGEGALGFASFETVLAGVGQPGRTIALSDSGYAPGQKVTYHSRLKKSYTAVQETYKTVMAS